MRKSLLLVWLGLIGCGALPLSAQTPVTLSVPREDATAADGDRAVPVTAKRADSAATTASANGKYGNLIADALGRLWVNCGTGCAGGTQYTHDGALTPSTTVGTMSFGRASATVPADVSADNDGSMLWLLRSGLLPVTLVTSAGVSLTPATDATHGSAANTTGPQIMGYGNATAPTAVTAGQAVRAWYTLAGAQVTTPIASATGGATPGYYISAASNNSTNLKASAGTVYSFSVINTTATLKYLRFYDSASAPTCTSGTGAVFYSPIPASTTGAGMVYSVTVGKNFATGIGWCLTGGAGVTDNTSTAVGDVVLTYDYK